MSLVEECLADTLSASTDEFDDIMEEALAVEMERIALQPRPSHERSPRARDKLDKEHVDSHGPECSCQPDPYQFPTSFVKPSAAALCPQDSLDSTPSCFHAGSFFPNALIFGQSDEPPNQRGEVNYANLAPPPRDKLCDETSSSCTPFEFRPSDLEVYSFAAIEEGAQNFNPRLVIGQGGFGKVYRGMLPYKGSWCVVAIKVMGSDGADQSAMFDNEVRLLGSLRHPNIVRLLGFCTEKALTLVYEYVEHGSLEDILIGGRPHLDWKQRVQILCEAAVALDFMHSMSPHPIMHRDFKPANILLDARMRVRLADVGLAFLAPTLAPDSSLMMSFVQDNTLKGTLGYMDPVYLSSGKFRPASDVYSLGITMLQMLTGNADPRGLVEHVDQAIESKAVNDVLDKRAGKCPTEFLNVLLNISMACTERRPKSRPNLRSTIISELSKLLVLAR